MRKRMIIIFVVALIVSGISLFLQRKGSCGHLTGLPLAVVCPEYKVRGYPLPVFKDTRDSTAISFGIGGFLLNTVVYFPFIYLLYFGYEIAFRKGKKK